MHALDTMRALASKAEVIHLNQGDVLFRTGETGTCMYGLLEGSVRLTWIDSAGHEGHERKEIKIKGRAIKKKRIINVEEKAKRNKGA